ncbi:uncharacterized protein LOC135500627 [Lineus longissimus]|uniref:uncharacterized protein LOC135500627 n=1 Tax=Lineus longissimus TaxID=88925 RepID=UPI002B4D0375
MKTVSILVLLAIASAQVLTTLAAIPVVTAKQGSTLKPAIGATVELQCTGGTAPYSWFKDDSTTKLADGGVVSGSATITLKLTKITKADYGKYKCTAKEGTSLNVELEDPTEPITATTPTTATTPKSGATHLSGLPLVVMMLAFVARLYF